MTVTRVEKHVIKQTNKYFNMLDEFCFRSKNLYNHANYVVRQTLFKSKEWVRYEDLDKQLRADKEYPDYTLMCCAVAAQQTLRLLDSMWTSYFKAIKDYKKHPEKYLGEPKFPKYKDKNGRYPIYLPSQACPLKDDNLVHFPRTFRGLVVKPKFVRLSNFSKFLQCRIIPKGHQITIELVYEVQLNELKNDNYRYLGIDLGVDNLAAVSNNVGAPFYLIDGKGLKSINRYWNKQSAKTKSDLQKGGRKIYTSNKLRRMAMKRNRKVNDYLHKASRYIIDFAVANDINKIVVGKNKSWKQNSNMRSTTNQKFVQIPHARFIDILKYKAESEGITLICVEESYTSKTSFLDQEYPCKHEVYAGKRTYRGLFRTNDKHLVNADSNGALQIIKKHTDYRVSDMHQIQHLLACPQRIHVN